MSNGYSDDLSIDRIDNEGNYTPKNCKFSTRLEQMANTRISVVTDKLINSVSKDLEAGGVLQKDICKKYMISQGTLQKIKNILKGVRALCI